MPATVIAEGAGAAAVAGPEARGAASRSLRSSMSPHAGPAAGTWSVIITSRVPGEQLCWSEPWMWFPARTGLPRL